MTFLRSLPTHQSPRVSIIEEWEDLEETDLEYEVPHSSSIGITETTQIEESLPPERQPLMLPSALDLKVEDDITPFKLTSSELDLRVGQANEALSEARLSIAQKSYLFRAHVRNNAPKQSYVTRSYGETQTVQRSIELSAKIYRAARKAMVKLGAPSSLLAKYQVLEKEDLRANTAVADSNAPGQRSDSLSWIWHMSSKDNANNPQYLRERADIYFFTLACIDI